MTAGSSASISRSEYSQSSFDANPSMSLIQERVAGLRGKRHQYDGSFSGASLNSQSTILPASTAVTISPESSVSRQYSITRVKALDHLEGKTRHSRAGSLNSAADYRLRLKELGDPPSVSSPESAGTTQSLASTWSKESAPDLRRVVRDVCGPSESSDCETANTSTHDYSTSSNAVTGSSSNKSRTDTSADDSTDLTTPRQSPTRMMNIPAASGAGSKFMLKELPKAIPSLVRIQTDEDRATLRPPSPKLQKSEDSMPPPTLKLTMVEDSLPPPSPNLQISEDSLLPRTYMSEDLARKIEGLRAYLDQARAQQFHSEIDDLVSIVGPPNSVPAGQGLADTVNSLSQPSVLQNLPMRSEMHESDRHLPGPPFQPVRIPVIDPVTASMLPILLKKVEEVLSRKNTPASPTQGIQVDLHPIVEKIESLFGDLLSRTPRKSIGEGSHEEPSALASDGVQTMSDSSASAKKASIADLCEKVDLLSAVCFRNTKNGANSYLTDSLWDGQQQVLAKVSVTVCWTRVSLRIDMQTDEICGALQVEQEKSTALEKQAAESSKHLQELNKVS